MTSVAGGTDWNALTAQVAGRFRALFADDFLGPAGVRRVSSVLKTVSLNGPRKMEELTSLLVMADLAGHGDVLLVGAEALRPVPFTGNVSNYEPIRQIFCGAVRRAELTGADAAPYREMMSLPERGEPGPPIKDGLIRQRAAGLLLKPPSKSAAVQATSGSHHIATVAIAVRELYLMWAFDGSFRWPRKKIDVEIDAAAAILRNLSALTSE
jgi:hypothetical protein